MGFLSVSVEDHGKEYIRNSSRWMSLPHAQRFSGLACNMCVLAYVTSALWEGMPYPLRGLWACCPASSGSSGWDIKRVNFQKLKTLSFLWKEAKIISWGTCVWEVKPPAVVCLCPTCLPFDFSKANTSRWMLEMSIKLFANTCGPVQTREERKPVPRVGSASVQDSNGLESGPTLNNREGLRGSFVAVAAVQPSIVWPGLETVVTCHQLCAQKQMKASRMYFHPTSPPTPTVGPSLLSLLQQPNQPPDTFSFSDRAWV